MRAEEIGRADAVLRQHAGVRDDAARAAAERLHVRRVRARNRSPEDADHSGAVHHAAAMVDQVPAAAGSGSVGRIVIPAVVAAVSVVAVGRIRFVVSGFRVQITGILSEGGRGDKRK